MTKYMYKYTKTKEAIGLLSKDSMFESTHYLYDKCNNFDRYVRATFLYIDTAVKTVSSCQSNIHVQNHTSMEDITYT